MKHEELAHAARILFPAGGWEVRGDEFTPPKGEEMPTAKALEDALIEHQSNATKVATYDAIRAGMADLWANAPDYIVGVFQEKMNVAEQLLDQGKPGAVFEMLQNIESPSAWAKDRTDTFNELFGKMQNGISDLLKI